MILTADMRKIARAFLADARVLLAGKRYDGAVYLCGYSVELALKARICRTLKWQGYPETAKEFQGLQSLKTHDLGLLLQLSGREPVIGATCFAEWFIVAQWSPESRYQPRVGNVTAADAQRMIEAAGLMLRKL